jgi:two-component system CheB/CheR fusion protein
MELFGGSIEVESAPDMGTAMHFAIPVGKTRRPQGRKVKETEDEGDRHALYLLVAEDDAINRLTLTRMLEQLGHRAHAVEDGSQALQALAEQHFDAVFLDIQMPVRDGMATLQAIRTGQVAGLPPTIPVVAVTAHAMQGDRERFMAKGADAYVQKPYDFTALEKALATLGRRVRPEGRTREDYSL